MNASFHHAPAVARPPLSRFISNGLRLEVESVGREVVHVRLRPASIGDGITDGPRVALSLSCADAQTLAGLLVQHSGAAAPSTSTAAGLIEHAADAIAGRSMFDSESLSHELRTIADALRGEVQS